MSRDRVGVLSGEAGPALAGFVIADAPAAWRAAGFTVDEDGTCRVGGLRLALVGADGQSGIVGWTFRGVQPATVVDGVDGLRTAVADAEPAVPARHPNGVLSLDHAVLLSPDLDRTVAALAALGADPRRERDAEMGGAPIRQVFYRLGEAVLEVVGTPGAHGTGPSQLWGLTYVVEDIDAAAAFFGENASPVKDAVQQGRRITTVRHRAFSISVATALISARAPAPG